MDATVVRAVFASLRDHGPSTERADMDCGWLTDKLLKQQQGSRRGDISIGL